MGWFFVLFVSMIRLRFSSRICLIKAILQRQMVSSLFQSDNAFVLDSLSPLSS